VPLWLIGLHLAFLGSVVATAHHVAVFTVLLLAFLAVVKLTGEHQSPLLLKNGFLVALFLAGLVVLGAPQRWWLEPILTNLSSLSLFLGAMGLTAFTDNAALTYLGSQVPGLSDASKYALVAGSVVGGGLTVIANAPNPVGYGILNPSFGKEGVSPLGLAASAVPPTIIAAVCFWFL
jgi:predicted cation transporter